MTLSISAFQRFSISAFPWNNTTASTSASTVVQARPDSSRFVQPLPTLVVIRSRHRFGASAIGSWAHRLLDIWATPRRRNENPKPMFVGVRGFMSNLPCSKFAPYPDRKSLSPNGCPTSSNLVQPRPAPHPPSGTLDPEQEPPGPRILLPA